MGDDGKIDYEKLLEGMKKIDPGNSAHRELLDIYHPSELMDPLLFPERPFLKEIKPDVTAKFEGYFKEISISTTPARFESQPYHLYHGTSTEALDLILESRTLRTGASLHREGQLVWGEMKRDLTKDDSYEPKGPKYLHPDILEKKGIELTEEDRKIFGHAFAVFFAKHPSRCLGYTPEDTTERAVLGVNRNALEDRGYDFVDCGSEGIKCESNISLDFGLQVLLVPDDRVNEYRDKLRGVYIASVYPLSDLDNNK